MTLELSRKVISWVRLIVTSQKPLPENISVSVNKKMDSKRTKRKAGERLGGVGGSELSSSTSVHPTLRSFGQTCEPKKSDRETNKVRCRRWLGSRGEDMSWITRRCPADSGNTLPQHLYCKLKIQNYRKRVVVIELLPYSAHSETALKPSSTTDNSEDVQKEIFSCRRYMD